MAGGAFVGIAAAVCNERGYSHPVFSGKGAFKETYRVLDSNHIAYALKIFDPHKFDLQRSGREIEAMTRCSCPFIGKLYDYSHISVGDSKFHYLIEDYFDGGNLSDVIKSNNIDHEKIKLIAISIASALGHLKSLSLVHRDIKPDNIMFNAGCSTPFLVDFGLVRDLGNESLTQTWVPQGPGTPMYSAPEQLTNDKALIDWRSDQFSLGVLLSMLINQCHPYQTKDNDVFQAIDSVSRRSEIPSAVKKSLIDKNFSPIVKMLSPWPIQRYCCPLQLKTALEGMG